ncbi:hypothetical protein [Arthrobacter sp.]|uniref:hypothetical protein n=1 Tax=Arthrobacter sp. TaxID=1667 RepID=UPI003A911807
MEGHAVEVSGDDVTRAIHAARERLAASHTMSSLLATQDVDEDRIRESVALAVERFGGFAPDSTRTVIAGYAAELTAVGAICRATTGEPPMEASDLDALGELLRRIFNGLFDK